MDKPISHYCWFHWTTDNGVTYHVCDKDAGHTDIHLCWVLGCEETWPNESTGKV